MTREEIEKALADLDASDVAHGESVRIAADTIANLSEAINSGAAELNRMHALRRKALVVLKDNELRRGDLNRQRTAALLAGETVNAAQEENGQRLPEAGEGEGS